MAQDNQANQVIKVLKVLQVLLENAVMMVREDDGVQQDQMALQDLQVHKVLKVILVIKDHAVIKVLQVLKEVWVLEESQDQKDLAARMVKMDHVVQKATTARKVTLEFRVSKVASECLALQEDQVKWVHRVLKAQQVQKVLSALQARWDRRVISVIKELRVYVEKISQGMLTCSQERLECWNKI